MATKPRKNATIGVKKREKHENSLLRDTNDEDVKELEWLI